MITNWASYYKERRDSVVYVPEAFIARFFLSSRPIRFAHNYKFANKTILDIGCGSGRHLNFFSTLGLHPTGVDVSLSQIDKSVAGTSNLAEGSFAAMPVFEKRFDFVVSVNSIYYCSSELELESNLKVVFDNLDHNGFAVISLVGDEHFVLNDSVDFHRYTYETSTREGFHQCGVNRVFVPRDRSALIDLFCRVGFSTSSIRVGRIKDELDGFVRDLYYVYARKGDLPLIL